MTDPVKVASLKARISMTVTLEGGAKKICHLQVDVQEIKTYKTVGGDLISLDGILAGGMAWIPLGDQALN